MPDRTPQDTLNEAVNRYLSTISAVATCVNEACPPVGGLYRHKFSRLRARLAFDPNPASIEESFALMEADLRQYAAKAAHHLSQHKAELRRGAVSLEALIQHLASRMESYGGRLRQIADQVRQESANAAPSPELVQGHAAGLLACLEGMSHEVLSLLAGLREEIHSVERRVAESETTDPVTGLMNRREMERQLAARRASGEPLTLLLFELRGDVTDEVAQQVATRLYSHFRPSDVIARWAPEEFLVLFLGPPEVAQTRTKQVVAWLTGKYPVANGELTEIQVSGHMLESAAASD